MMTDTEHYSANIEHRKSHNKSSNGREATLDVECSVLDVRLAASF